MSLFGRNDPPPRQHGLGRPMPSRFPYADRPQPAPSVGPSQGVVTRANRVIVFGPTGAIVGVFVYQPGTTPALGNGPIDWMTASTVDPFGNVLPTPGTGTQGASGSGLGWAALSGGSLYLNVSGGTLNLAGQLAAPASGEVQLTGSLQALGDQAATMILLSKNFAGTPIPVIEIGSPLVNCGLTVMGPVNSTLGTPSDPSTITTDTWHQVTVFLNNWTSPNGFYYKLTTNNSLMFAGQLANTAGTAGNSQAFTLTAPYLTANRVEFGIATEAAAPNVSHSIQFDTAGHFQVNTAAGANDHISVSWECPLDVP